MDHQSAVENHTAERYLLGELSNADRDAYEEHFFSCPACAEEVRSADEFMQSARKVVQEELKVGAYNNHGFHRSVWGRWLNWRSMLQPVPAMACALLVAVSGFSVYQNRVVIPRLGRSTAAQVMTTPPFMLRHARGGANTETVPKDESFTLGFDIPPSNCSSYDVSVLDESKNKKLSFANIPAEKAKKTLEIIVPTGTLNPGSYIVLINGTDGTSKGEVDRFTFTLKFED